MYKHKYRNAKFNKRRGNRGNRGKRPIKTFDPTYLANNSDKSNTKNIEYVADNSFKDFNLNPTLYKNIVDKGYKNPTPIQDQSIRPILQNKDIVGLAGTGTGKTAAFLIPLINNFINNKSRVLILAPTRELALQIEQELRDLSKGTEITSAKCIGGVNINRQISDLYKNPSFVVGTPGRLIDLSNRQKIDFNKFECIVLDEVDRMLDMGFVNDIKLIISKLPAKRHSLFFSATLPNSLNEIVNTFTNNPVKVQVEQQEASKNVNQKVINVNGKNKTELLHDLLITEGFDKVLVFGRTKHGLNNLSKDLTSRGFETVVIHGNKSQHQRQKALQHFKNDNAKVMLATDIAARGLDIDDISHVINYDLPQTEEEYIHRIGRTGRANKLGTAISFVG